MKLLDKVRDGFLEHIGTACAAALTGLLGWLFYQLAPSLTPALQAIPLHVVLAILLLSIALNVALVVTVWRLSRPQQLKLMFGILWDKEKNPHCPVCKNPGLKYGEYGYQLGYHCNPCKQLFPLADASGNDVAPAVAINAL